MIRQPRKSSGPVHWAGPLRVCGPRRVSGGALYCRPRRPGGVRRRTLRLTGTAYEFPAGRQEDRRQRYLEGISNQERVEARA